MLQAIALAASLAAQGTFPEPITVSAAISLTEVMEEIGTAYVRTGGGRVVFNFGGSNTLARQIVNGAPVDVFISADEAQMAVIERAGMVSAGTRMPLAGNQLAIVVSRQRSEPVTSAADLAAPGIRRVAIGLPEAVPGGVYAKRYLERIGLWHILEPKLLPSVNVRAALVAVENGSADAAMVYVTDARVSTRVRIATIIAGAEAPPIVYPACVVESSRRKEQAAAFVKFLQTPEVRDILQRHGFQPLTSGR